MTETPRARILVADDDADILDLLVFKLTDAGFEVIAVTDGVAALMAIEADPPRLAILDIKMPGLSGIEVLQQIRASKSLSDLNVILLTASADDADVDSGLAAGASDYITKPFSPDQLMHRVNALAEQNPALRQKQTPELDTHQLVLELGHAMRAAADAQQALDVMCSRLGEGLGVDRVIAITLGIRRDVRLGAQWHRPDLQRLGDLAGPVDLGELAEELWLSSGFWEEHDLLEAELPPPGAIVALLHDSGARAGVTVPIGLDDRVIGVIHVLTVDHPRAWSRVETDVIQTAAEFVAKAIVGIEHQANHRQYLDRVETLDRQKSDFLATVSHELRTPLTSISGYLELLQGEDAGPLTPQQRRMLEAIDRNTLRLRNLIEDVMLSRIEGGVSEPTFVEVSIRTLITRVSKELIPLAHHRSVELEIDTGSPTATVLGNRAALSRAVATVLSNAIKFSRPGGAVTLQGARDPGTDRILITCQDHGVGIPATDMPDLFTRFFRASNAIRNETQGSGLGLSIAKTIIEDHRGVLRLTSVEGEGTTVVMDLPLYDPSQTQPLRDPRGRVGTPPWFDSADRGAE